MKAKIRVATDMYEFIELEVDGTSEQLWDTYKELKAYTKEVKGLSDKEFNAALDEYLNTNSIKNGTEIYAQMNPQQQSIIQAIKRSIKRIEIKNGK